MMGREFWDSDVGRAVLRMASTVWMLEGQVVG